MKAQWNAIFGVNIVGIHGLSSNAQNLLTGSKGGDACFVLPPSFRYRGGVTDGGQWVIVNKACMDEQTSRSINNATTDAILVHKLRHDTTLTYMGCVQRKGNAQ